MTSKLCLSCRPTNTVVNTDELVCIESESTARVLRLLGDGKN